MNPSTPFICSITWWEDRWNNEITIIRFDESFTTVNLIKKYGISSRNRLLQSKTINMTHLILTYAPFGCNLSASNEVNMKFPEKIASLSANPNSIDLSCFTRNVMKISKMFVQSLNKIYSNIRNTQVPNRKQIYDIITKRWKIKTVLVHSKYYSIFKTKLIID